MSFREIYLSKLKNDNLNMPNFRLSLVSEAGILLASKPELVDNTKQVLATGLITAMVSFSKEIHKRELQSIDYHDRSIITVPINEFILVLEIMEGEEISEKAKSQISELLRKTGSSILEGLEPSSLSEGEASLLVNQCLYSVERLFVSQSEHPIKQAEINEFVLDLSNETWQVKNNTLKQNDSLQNIIINMLYEHKTKVLELDKMESILMLFPKEKTCSFIILRMNEDELHVGYLKFPSALDYTLFRLFPVFETKLELLSKGKYRSLREILEFLRDSEDPGTRFAKVNKNYISFNLLNRLIENDLEKLYHSVIVGDLIFVLGDKISVKLVIDILSILTQHLQTQFIRWTDENFVLHRTNRFIPKIIGINYENFEKLLKEKKVPRKATIVDLNNRETKGFESSIYFAEIINKMKDKKVELDAMVETLERELNHLISMTYILSSYALLERKTAQKQLKEMKTQWSYPPELIKKALKLAQRINPFLSYL